MKYYLIYISFFITINSFGQTSTFNEVQLQEIKNKIGNNTIVALEEYEHGFESINEIKSSFVNFLQSDMNFQAIAFESSFTESIISFLNNDSLIKRTSQFLYPFWNTKSVNHSLKSIYEAEKLNDKPLIVGFDIQEDCRYESLSKYLTTKNIVIINRDKLIESDLILAEYIGIKRSKNAKMQNETYLNLLNNYEQIQNEILTSNLKILERKLLGRSIQNRMWLLKLLTFSNFKDKMYFRDSLMAANIVWYHNEIYHDNKFIIWAANEHLFKSVNKNKSTWTGEWLSKEYSINFFGVSFRKSRIGNTNNAKELSIEYKSKSNEKFDLVVGMQELIKISSLEWITNCEQNNR